MKLTICAKTGSHCKGTIKAKVLESVKPAELRVSQYKCDFCKTM
jgi:hypothetical protein